MDPLQQVYHTLGLTLTTTGDIRRNAELKIEEYSKQPGYVTILTQIFLNAELALPTRQLAGILLKQTARKSWTEPHVTAQDKTFFRQNILQTLADPSKKIRNASAMAIAAASTIDYPEEWPTLFQELCSLLGNANPHVVDGSLKTLSIVLPDASVDQTPEIANHLLPQLLQFIVTDQALEGRAVRAMSVVGTIFTMINHMEKTKLARDLVRSIVPGWIQVFVTILGASDDREVMFNLKGETLQCISTLFSSFPKILRPYLDSLLPIMWNCLTTGYVIYERQVVFNPEYESEYADSEGESCGVETYLGHLFSSLQSVLESPSLSKALEPSLLPLLQILINYMQLNEQMIELASEDPNQFIADEDDDALTMNVRNMAQSFVQSIFDVFGKKSLSVIRSAIDIKSQEAQQKLQAGDQNWWRLREASVLAIRTLWQEITEIGAEAFSLLNIPEFINTVRTIDLNPSAPPFLQAQGAKFISSYIPSMTVDQARELLQVCLHLIQLNQPFHLRIAACSLLYKLSTRLSSADMKAVIGPICQSVCQLISLTSNDTFHIVLETLTAVLRVDAEASAAVEPELTPFILNLWTSQPTDPLMAANVTDIIEQLARIPQCRPSLYQRCIPLLSQSLAQPHQLGVIENVVEVAHALIKHSDNHLEPIVAEMFLPNLILAMQTSTDNSLLQNGAHFLMSVVRTGSPLLIERTDSQGVSLLHHILAIVSKLLDPSVDENASIFVGALVSKLVFKYGSALGNSVNQMLEACVRRLATAKLLSLIQSLLLVFCRLIHSNGLSVLDFLTTINVGETNGLIFVLTTWLNNQSFFYGDYEIKISLTALTKILQSRDPRLMNIPVQGDLIATPGRHKLRSKATQDKYTTVPLFVKILHLLVDQFSVEIAGEEATANTNAGDNDDDEYEDEEDEEDDDDESNENSGKRTFLPGFGGEFRPLNSSGVFAPADSYIDLMNAARFEDDDDESDSGEDPDARLDPIYSLDIKEFIKQSLKGLSEDERAQLVVLMQSDAERHKSVTKILSAA